MANEIGMIAHDAPRRLAMTSTTAARRTKPFYRDMSVHGFHWHGFGDAKWTTALAGVQSFWASAAALDT
jgi:hypothetical protein